MALMAERIEVLLVDDEPLVTIGLESTVDWSGLGCKVIGSARGGQEALRIIADARPELVVTDIRMPGSDGLELIRTCRSEGYDAQFIVLSVLNDFEHVREALRLGAADYIVKSDVTPETVARAIDEAKRRIERHGRSSRPADLSEALLGMVSEVGWAPPEALLEAFSSSLPEYRAIVVRLDNLHLIRERQSQDSLVPFFVAAADLVRRSFGKEAITTAAQGERFLVAAPPDTEAANTARRIRSLAARFRDVLNATVSVGISSRHTKPNALGQAFTEASDALMPSFFAGPGYVGHPQTRLRQHAHAGDDSADAGSACQALETILTSVGQHAVRWNLDAVRTDVKNLHGAVSSRANTLSPDAARGYYVAALESILANGPAENRSLPVGNQHVFAAFVQATDLDTIHAAFLAHLDALQEAAEQRLRYNSTRPVDRAVQLIHRHFDSGISLQSIAEQVHVTPSYLSRSFSKEVGMKFTEYLATTRVERAKHLLASGTRRVGEIAHQVGYDDPAYFSRVFRRITGLSPEEFARRAPDNQ